MWLSTDPALGEYIPGLDKDKNKNLPGMGGLFNQINANLFHAFGNNPIRYVDPEGRYIEVKDNYDGTYTVVGGIENQDKNIYIVTGGTSKVTILGEMFTEHSFFDGGNLVKGAVIDTSDMSGMNFLNDFKENTPDLIEYIFNARNGEKFDFKDIGAGNKRGQELNQHRHRGMELGKNKSGNKIFGTARDVGNYAAGYVSGKNGLSLGEARLGFDLYQSIKSKKISREGIETVAAENLGFDDGYFTTEGKILRSCYESLRESRFPY